MNEDVPPKDTNPTLGQEGRSSNPGQALRQKDSAETGKRAAEGGREWTHIVISSRSLQKLKECIGGDQRLRFGEIEAGEIEAAVSSFASRIFQKVVERRQQSSGGISKSAVSEAEIASVASCDDMKFLHMQPPSQLESIPVCLSATQSNPPRESVHAYLEA